MGTVTVLTGDHMPPVEIPDSGAPAAMAPVHVLRGAHAPTAHLDRTAADYVGSTTTDASGVFRVALPPGTYTVLIEHDGMPYLNSFSGDGTWTTVTVTAGAWAAFEIRDTAGATF
ncbi:MAG: carboxypeptidase-like regulatory domain-containing protein [Sandaracinaceae bacterium]